MESKNFESIQVTPSAGVTYSNSAIPT